MNFESYLKKVIECMKFLDAYLNINELSPMYDFCCLKFGSDVVGLGSFVLLAMYKGGRI